MMMVHSDENPHPSAKRLNIRGQVVNLCSRQRQVRHRRMWMRKKGAQLSAGEALSNRSQTGRSLLDRARRCAGDDMAVGAPALRHLRPFTASAASSGDMPMTENSRASTLE
jgi:hypothetical protein